MHQLLIDHIDSLIGLKDELVVDSFFSDFQKTLKSDYYKDLSLPVILKALKKSQVFKTKVKTSFAEVAIKIKGRCDYMALMNGAQISCSFFDDKTFNSLNSDNSANVNYILRQLLIAHLYKETNQEWLHHVSKSKEELEALNLQIIEAINIPPMIYCGEVVFSKYLNETRRTLAKSWQLICTKKTLLSDESFNEGWLAVKVIVLNHGVKKVFYKHSSDPKAVIHWLITPLAKRDPSADKLLFDLRNTKQIINHDQLNGICNSLLACHSESLEALSQRYDNFNNEVPLSQIKKNILNVNQ